MIQIDLYPNGFKVNGHANYDTYGRDIVCAAVSGVVIGAMNWFEQRHVLHCKMEDHVPVIEFFIKKAQDNNIALSLVFVQLRTISFNYPEYVVVKKHRKPFKFA